jgi:hypothetical protein
MFGEDGPAMRRRSANPVAAVTLLAALAAGCGALPGRYTSEQLERVGGELTTADSIYAELGPPDLRREDARIWIYAWEDPVPYPRRSFLVLQFDAEGRLSNREVALAVKPSQGGLDGLLQSARYCTEGGTCVEHGIATDDGIRFDDSFSAVTVKGAAQERVVSPKTAANECLLVVWPGEGWTQSHSSIGPPDGVAVSIEGSSKWSYYRWLPVGAYARIVLPAGEHVLSVRDPMWDARTSDQTTPEDDLPWGEVPWWMVILDQILTAPAYSAEELDRKPRTAPVHCRAGETLYLVIDATFKGKGQHWFPIELRPVDAVEAQALMLHLSQLLPPDQ